MTRAVRGCWLTACLVSTLHIVLVRAQAPAAPPQEGRGGRGAALPAVVSPEVTADRRIVFRIAAPQATSVRLTASDIPSPGPFTQLVKGTNGVWETTTPPVPAGAYRYTFNIDGVATIDPRNPLTSESRTNSWSLVNVPGGGFTDTRNIPHGHVAEVTYYSSALKTDRRMHIYTPTGYETSTRKYPVFYLLHGAGDSDDSWSTVGRAGFILDNLIADRKAKPMIVVMPAGHTPDVSTDTALTIADPFGSDFVTDIVPYVQKTYRVFTDRANTAMAGLSMGGVQTLNIAIPNLEKFGYIGVFSSGLIGSFARAGRGGAPGTPAPPGGSSEWEARNAATLDEGNLKKGLKVLWFSTGKNDSLLETTTGTVAVLKKHGFSPVFQESEGGHTWLNWRDYLYQFAPLLFQ